MVFPGQEPWRPQRGLWRRSGPDLRASSGGPDAGAPPAGKARARPGPGRSRGIRAPGPACSGHWLCVCEGSTAKQNNDSRVFL